MECKQCLALYVLNQIITSLPSNKDWLDPDLEKIAREIIQTDKHKPCPFCGDRSYLDVQETGETTTYRCGNIVRTKK